MIKSTLFPTECLKHFEPHGRVFKPNVVSQKSLFLFKLLASRTCFMRNQRKRKKNPCKYINPASLKIFASRNLPISKTGSSTSKNLTHPFWVPHNLHFSNRLQKGRSKMAFTEGHRGINPVEVSPLNKQETDILWVKSP